MKNEIINLIIVFLLILFAFIIGTVLYYKAYRVNNGIANTLEKYEGYNNLSEKGINNFLKYIGYVKASKYDFSTDECPIKHDQEAITEYSPNYMYCIYEIPVDDNYYKYGVLTYINLEIPVVDAYFRFPIYSESERIYYFNEK